MLINLDLKIIVRKKLNGMVEECASRTVHERQVRRGKIQGFCTCSRELSGRVLPWSAQSHHLEQGRMEVILQTGLNPLEDHMLCVPHVGLPLFQTEYICSAHLPTSIPPAAGWQSRKGKL